MMDVELNIMEETRHFDRLTAELSVEERGKLLDKLTSQASFSSALYDEPENTDNTSLEDRYKTIPWYYRLWFFIVSFFNNRSPAKIFEDHVMAQVYHNMEEKAPGFYNYSKDILLPKFRDELSKLKDGSRFFFHALDAGVNRDRGGFMVFLGSLEMPEIHKRILDDADPASLASRWKDISDVELRQKAIKAMEDAFGGITEEGRIRMYRSARSLYCLKQLSSFLFDRMINIFTYDTSSQGYICSSSSVRDQLKTLHDILSSLKEPPPLTLLESLFVFVLMEEGGESDMDIQAEMRKLLARAETSLQSIREFNLEVPLAQLLRCITRDVSYSPRNIGGGEDWYAVYRERWKFQVEESFLFFIKTRRQRDLQNAFRFFLKGTNLVMLENMGSDQNPGGINVKGNFSLSFLRTFYSAVFMAEINQYIRPILLDGEFTKKENRTEFTECYNNLIRLEDVIGRFDSELSPSGDYGKRYAQAKNDMSSLPVKRRKIQIVVEEAAGDAEGIISRSREALEGMVNILGGILKKGSSDRYGTLANLSVIAGRGSSFTEGIEESLNKCKKALQLLDDIDAMEAGR